MTETVLALRLYHAEHGELPAKLNQLVPAYLAAVPLDYDRQPIRYSREKFAVWSADPRHFMGSSDNPNPDETTSEFYHRLDFAAPPRPAPAENPASPSEASPPKAK